jgi:chemotaxis protein MotB
VDVPGVDESRAGDGIILTFPTGLFDGGTHFVPGAEARIVAVARGLKACSGSIRVGIEGCTDDTPVPPNRTYHDNLELGMARAAAVFGCMREASGMPPRAYHAVSRGAENPLFPNDCRENRNRNRTVVVRIEPWTEPATETP